MPDTYRPRTPDGRLAPFHLRFDTRPVHAYRRSVDTACGVRVRSHPERQIADALHASGLRWEYEPTLHVGGSKPLLCPDFFVQGAAGHAWIWEHAGMLDVGAYLAKHSEKMKLYDDLGIVRIEYGGGEFVSLILTSTAGRSSLSESQLSTAVAFAAESDAA